MDQHRIYPPRNISGSLYSLTQMLPLVFMYNHWTTYLTSAHAELASESVVMNVAAKKSEHRLCRSPWLFFYHVMTFFALAKEFFEEYSVVLEKKSGLMTKLQSAADMQIMLADGRSLLQKNYTEGVQS